jgi:hypothetical protein
VLTQTNTFQDSSLGLRRRAFTPLGGPVVGHEDARVAAVIENWQLPTNGARQGAVQSRTSIRDVAES